MAASPLSLCDGVIKYSISADGASLKDNIKVLMIEVCSEVNRVPSARIIVSDGDMSGKDFPLSTESCFKPGTLIEIKAGYASNESLIFSGLVIGIGISIGINNESSLVIECQDKCVAMTIARTSANYTSKTDSQIIEEIIGNYSGLNNSVTATSSQYNELVQFNCTDWDFILSRAEANGYVICVDAGTLTIGAPQVTGSAELTVTYGEDLIDFSAHLDARYQLSSVNGVCWDPATQKILQEQVEAQTLNKQGDLSSCDLAAILSIDNFCLQTSNTLDSASLKAWAKGQQIKSALARIQGNMKFQGSAIAKIGSLIEIVGVGSRFNGLVYVSRVHHELVNGQWLTDIDFGMSPHWSSEHRDISAPPASGLLPAVEGLQIGVVMKLDGDPSGQNRIQVQLPVLQASTAGVWARLATFYASEDIGNFFIPEIDDEVVLGYFNNNPSEPVILGSLYSSMRKPAYALTAENNIKAIITKSKLKIEFNEKDKVITIITPGANKVVINDKDKSIILEDQNSNKLVLNSTGITLDSPKDIKISAKGKITLSALGEMSLSSKADLKLAGLNINQTAQVGFVAKGSASAELSASGQTIIKGAIVMIN